MNKTDQRHEDASSHAVAERDGANQPAPPASFTPTSQGPAPESLDTVRDILFGGQMRSVEARLQAMEERILREQSMMRSDLEKRIAELDTFAREQFKELGDRLNTERAKRTEEIKSLNAELLQLFRDLEKRHAKLQEATMLADAEIRDQLMMHASATANEFARTTDTLSTELTKSHTELMTSKTDRHALANLFTDIAARLAGAAPHNGQQG